MINPTATFSAPEFFHMLAKIAHSYAVAELGVDGFEPFLLPVIRDADLSNVRQYIGGVERTEPASSDLHGLSIIDVPGVSPDLICIRVRLLACLETPTYAVAVGRRR